MTDKEIKNLIDRHEIFVSEEYKSKGIKARFTEFGRMATVNAIKEILKQKEEFEKCKNDSYYFFKNYVLINGQHPTMTREQFNELVLSWDIKTKRR